MSNRCNCSYKTNLSQEQIGLVSLTMKPSIRHYYEIDWLRWTVCVRTSMRTNRVWSWARGIQYNQASRNRQWDWQWQNALNDSAAARRNVEWSAAHFSWLSELPRTAKCRRLLSTTETGTKMISKSYIVVAGCDRILWGEQSSSNTRHDVVGRQSQCRQPPYCHRNLFKSAIPAEVAS